MAKQKYTTKYLANRSLELYMRETVVVELNNLKKNSIKSLWQTSLLWYRKYMLSLSFTVLIHYLLSTNNTWRSTPTYTMCNEKVYSDFRTQTCPRYWTASSRNKYNLKKSTTFQNKSVRINLFKLEVVKVLYFLTKSLKFIITDPFISLNITTPLC